MTELAIWSSGLFNNKSKSSARTHHFRNAIDKRNNIVTILVAMSSNTYTDYLNEAVAGYAKDNVESGRWW